MEAKYDAIIIGTGIGGTAVGALLAHAGWKILILDKNPIVGGRCTSYEKDGFIVDLGVHLFGLGDRGALGDICRRINLPHAIQWVPIGAPSLMVKDRIERYSRKTMTGMLSANEKNNLERLFEEITSISDHELEKLWYVPLKNWVRQFTEDPLDCAFIERIQSQYFCVPGFEASTTEFIRCFRHVVGSRSSAYPKGGCISIPKAYISAIEKREGKCLLNAKAAEVIVDKGKAVGVRLEKGTQFHAPVIISNADIKSTVSELVGEKWFPGDYVRKINNLVYAYNGISLKVALREKVTDDQLMMYLPYDFERSAKVEAEKMRGILPDKVRGMITSPTNYDPSLAPEGKQLIFFITACPPNQEWAKWEKVMLDSFYTVYPQARNKRLWHCLDTPDLVKAFAGEEGNIIGVAQRADQIHEKRPSVVSPLKGLYFSSAEAGGHGIGAELAADSARELFAALTCPK